MLPILPVLTGLGADACQLSTGTVYGECLEPEYILADTGRDEEDDANQKYSSCKINQPTTETASRAAGKARSGTFFLLPLPETGHAPSLGIFRRRTSSRILPTDPSTAPAVADAAETSGREGGGAGTRTHRTGLLAAARYYILREDKAPAMCQLVTGVTAVKKGEIVITSAYAAPAAYLGITEAVDSVLGSLRTLNPVLFAWVSLVYVPRAVPLWPFLDFFFRNRSLF